MRPLAFTALAALLAGAPAAAQTYGQGYGQPSYPPSTYDRGAQPGYPPSTYDRGGYPPSGYDTRGQGQPQGGYGQGGYGQAGYDQGPQGGAGAEDPRELARRLNLTPAQQAAFDAYRRAFAPDQARAQQEDEEMRRMASLSTPQRLDMARASLARDRADFDRTDSATRAFYAQLSPSQRRTFDQLTAPQMDEGGQGGPSPTQPAGAPR
jgi:hypothetical protein